MSPDVQPAMTPDELKKARLTASLTRTQVAALVGMSERSIYRYENGEYPIDQRTATALRLAFQVARNTSSKKSRKLKQAS